VIDCMVRGDEPVAELQAVGAKVPGVRPSEATSS